MPTSAGPNIIGENNTILAYDTGDTVNSYKGEPTTNLQSNGGLVGISGISLTYLSVEDGWKKYSMSGTFTGGTYPYIMYISSTGFTGGLQYTSKCTIKTNVIAKFNYFGTSGINYVNQPMTSGGAASSISNLDGSFTVSRAGFIYTSTTNQPGYLLTNPINNTTFNSSTDFVWIKDLQVEQNSHATQFINGTRSVTQGLLPIISNTSLDLSNMSYTSNAQITFDGTNDYIDIGNLGTIGNEYSIECIFNSSAVVNYRNVFDMNYATYAGVTGNVGPRLEQYSDGTFTIAWSGVTNNNSLVVGTTPISISANTNYHVTFVQNGLNGSVYLNGVYRNQTSNTYGYIQTFGDANLGRGFELAGDRYFIGSLPVFKVYNRALISSEVQQNYKQYKSRFNLS
jgi:hypothetical protein